MYDDADDDDDDDDDDVVVVVVPLSICMYVCMYAFIPLCRLAGRERSGSSAARICRQAMST